MIPLKTVQLVPGIEKIRFRYNPQYIEKSRSEALCTIQQH